MMRLLVKNGADVSRRDRQGATALEVAVQEGLEAPRCYLQQVAEKPNQPRHEPATK
jgi:ankyrin repeat protein